MSTNHKRALQLDGRLTLATRMIAPCNICADIGADHGLLSASLLESGIAKHMLVADVSAKALHKAEVLLGHRSLSKQATFSVADGLDALHALPDHHADTICILGMGGQTVAGILKRGETLLDGATLLLGAQTELPLLRQTLCDLGYRIRKEEIAKEGKHLYVLMKCTPMDVGEPVYDETDLLLGPLLKTSPSPLFEQWLKKRKQLLQYAISSMQSASQQQNQDRLSTCLEELHLIDHALVPFLENVCLEDVTMKTITVQMVADWVNELAPFDSAESFDNVGLLIGNPQNVVHHALFCVDVTADVLQTAIDLQANLIISHHPIIFSPLRRIDYTTPQGALLQTVLANDISILSAHTNLDRAPDGICDALAHAFALEGITTLDPFIRMGSLPSAQSMDALRDHITDVLGFAPRMYGTCNQEIERIAVSGGAYGEGAVCAHQSGAQAYIVGEIRHHELLEACTRGLVVYEAGHFATEYPGMVALSKRFEAYASSQGLAVSTHLCSRAPYRGALQI